MNEQAKQATPHGVLIEQIMDCRVPKNEREHAAAREIERLRKCIAEADEAFEQIRHLNTRVLEIIENQP